MAALAALALHADARCAQADARADGQADGRAGAAPSASEQSRTTPALTRENVAAFFDAAFDVQRRDHQMVGAVVSVVRDGGLLFERGYGWADLEARVPADPTRSLFRIASITKTFVWTALMQLVEEGRVELDADVNRSVSGRAAAAPCGTGAVTRCSR